MKEYTKPLIEEEIIENDDIIMASTDKSNNIDASKGIKIGDLFGDNN